jgi:hypothetical protein
MPRTKIGSSNGGIIGKTNKASFGKCTVTSKTSSGSLTTQPGTAVVNVAIVGGGAGGNSGNVSNGGGGGGGGGIINQEVIVSGNTAYSLVIGGGGPGGVHPTSPTANPPAYGAAGTDSTGFSLTGGGAPIHQFHPPGPSERAKGGGPSGSPQCSAAGTSSDRGGSGGGGAGGVGGNSPSNAVGGVGGNGLLVSTNCTTYSGGGGGSGWEASAGQGSGAGGPGGGGAGGTGTTNPGSAGSTNTGGGGGGGAGSCGISGTKSAGGNGGSGIAVVKELSKASGVWSMQSQFSAQSQGTWPKLLVSLDYLVVAGGGSGSSGGGGAGGYRASGYGPSPLQNSSITLASGTYDVTIGAGASAAPSPYVGSDSIFNPGGTENTDTITADGGGMGAGPGAPSNSSGGSGGGGRVYPPEGAVVAAGAGNTPPRSPIPQGNPGGTITFPSPIGPQGGATIGFAGGGGAGAPGAAVTLNNCFAVTSGSLNGGAGAPNTITGSDVSYAGGGGGFTQLGASFVAGGTGGAGGGGTTTSPGSCAAGGVNTGGGAGASFSAGGLAGGSGIVVIRAPSDRTFAVTPGTNSTSTHPGGDKIATFTVSGTLTVS